MAYAKRYVGGFVDLPSTSTPIDSTFLNAVEAALLSLFDTNPASANMVPVWTPAGTHYVPQLITNASIDPAAAIAKSKLAALSIVDADVAGGAAIARSKLNFGSGLVDADIATAAAIALSKLAGYPTDITKYPRGDGTWAAFASSQSTPGDPAGTTSTVGVMMGLGGAITPTATGKVLITVYGWIANTGITADARVQICTGTGTAPVNGAAATGTARGTNADYAPSSSGNRTPFSTTVLVTGLTPATAYWIDLKAWTTDGTKTTTLGGVTISAVELP